jgi:hypothetical protein
VDRAGYSADTSAAPSGIGEGSRDYLEGAFRLKSGEQLAYEVESDGTAGAR